MKGFLARYVAFPILAVVSLLWAAVDGAWDNVSAEWVYVVRCWRAPIK